MTCCGFLVWIGFVDAAGAGLVLTGSVVSGFQDAQSDGGAAAVDGEHGAIDVGGLLGAEK